MTTQETRLLAASQIMAGLLATGKYTEMKEVTDENGRNPVLIPKLVTCDLGKGWEETGEPQRHMPYAVWDAAELLDAIQHTVE